MFSLLNYASAATKGPSLMLTQLFFRFLVGGIFVSAFAILGTVFKPKSFAGLFGAAPSIALATLALTIRNEGRVYAAIEARSKLAGAAAFFVYAWRSMLPHVTSHPQQSSLPRSSFSGSRWPSLSGSFS
jgi:hypothetical protein